MTGVSAADVEAVYDLHPHGITVAGAPEGAKDVDTNHISTAVQFRSLDRKLWRK